MSDPYLGEVRMFCGNFAPSGWALCNGQSLAIQSNTALFSLLGTTYGGDGIQTFSLPNMQGRVAVHFGTLSGGSPYQLGQVGGTENVTLLTNQMPTHTHLHNASAASADQLSPVNSLPAVVSLGSGRAATQTPAYTQTAATGTMAATAIAVAGGNQPHSNMQPYVCVTFIISLQGIYPPRS